MNPVSPASPVAQDEWRERVSRLVDGDAGPDEVAALCRRWSDDEQARAAWHEYHLIGDVLRSEELAAPTVRQSDFLSQLRLRLQDEPVVLAPSPAAAASRRASRRPPRWLGGVAVAAGFMAVAGVLVVSRVAAPGAGEDAPALAQQQPPAAEGLRRAAVATAPAVPGAASAVALDEGRLIRDARIDQYFEAHRGMRAMPSAALPGGGLRNVDTLVPAR